MAKFNFNLRDRKSEESPIYLVIRWNNNRLVYPTGETISPAFWQTDKTKSDFQRVKSAKKDLCLSELNSRLDNIEQAAKETFRRYVNDNNSLPTIEALRSTLNKKFNVSSVGQLDLKKFFDLFIEEAKTKQALNSGRAISPGTIKLYQNARKHIIEFSKGYKRRVDFDTIDLEFYNDFSRYLSVQKAFAKNTVGRIIKTLKTVMNDATEKGINTNLAFRSKKFKVHTEISDSIYLNNEEVKLLYNLDLSGNKKHEKVRDLFILGCYTGLRFSDFTNLKPENFSENRITIETQKTGNSVTIPIDIVVSQILKKYDNMLPKYISNQKMNEYLKELANDPQNLQCLQKEVSVKCLINGVTMYKKKKKYELITTHTARRSFATNFYLSGVPAFSIMQITGHKTEKAFQQYIKITKEDSAKIIEIHMNKNHLKTVTT